MKTIKSSEQTRSQEGSETWFDSGRQDIERLIEHMIAPYVDYGNVFLHRDELRDECWSKVSALVSGGWLERCHTRQKFFALLKVGLRNHIYSHVHKYAFTSKRTGIDPVALRNNQVGSLQKAVHIRVDDPNETFQVTSADADLEMSFVLRDFMQLLAPQQQGLLNALLLSSGSGTGNRRSIRRLRAMWDSYLNGEPAAREIVA